MGTDVSTDFRAAPLVPPADWDDLDSRAHSVQFYGDDAVLLDGLSRFIGSALRAGDAGVVIATKAHRAGLAKRLTARGLDITLAAKQGRFISLDAAEVLAQFTLDGWPDGARFADLLGGIIGGAAAAVNSEHQRVAAFGEMVALLWAEGKREAAIRLEQLWNDLAQTHGFSLRCAYPMSFFSQAGDGVPLGKICAEHARVIPAESYTSLIGEEERLRAITFLQQKAQALETEIAERKRIEQMLRERNQELREAVSARDEFLSVAAHELKTPMTSLRAYAQLLLMSIRRKREIAPERLGTALETIETQTGKLNSLVSHLLDRAQIEAGKLRIEPVRTDLVALVQAVVAQHQGRADYPVVYDGPEHLDAAVDPVRFEQVITNLVDNAIKYSPHGGTVSLRLEQGDGGIRLSVTDQGVGIPPEQREAVFDRFHQARGERHLSGMGLGLYITREIVALHGGSVRIEEPEHRGSRFVVALPPSANGIIVGTAAQAVTK